MPRIHIKYLICIFFGSIFLLGKLARGQDNLGIGTKNPHASAILQISDSSRGVLIPRTDTMAVLNYVNTLTPKPGIADGLLIMDTLVNTYLFYDALENRWKKLIGLIGPTGPQGFRGPPGPTGPTGLGNDWRDSALSTPDFNPMEDTCGDWFINPETGKIWWMWCDTLGGGLQRMWIDTTWFDNPIGLLMAPDEKIITQQLKATAPLLETMANDTQLVILKPIPGLSTSITVNVDEDAHIWVAAHGVATKFISGSDYSYAQYEIRINPSGGGVEIYGGQKIDHFITLGPNSQSNNTADRAGWYLSASFHLKGEYSKDPVCHCGHPHGAHCVPCPGPSTSASITVLAGNRYSGSATSSLVNLADEPGKEAVGYMNVFAIIRTAKGALPWKR